MSDLGTDVFAVSDLDASFRLVSGRQALAQAIARRLSTRRGELAVIGDDPDYGLDVRDFLNDDVGAVGTFEIEAAVSAEVLKDERVASATVTAQIVSGALLLAIGLVDGDGPFRLTLAVSDVTVTILKVQ